MTVGENALAHVTQLVEDLAATTRRAEEAEATAARASREALIANQRADRAEDMLRRIQSSLANLTPATPEPVVAVQAAPVDAPAKRERKPARTTKSSKAKKSGRRTNRSPVRKGRSTFGLGMPIANPTARTVGVVRSVNPETKTKLLDAVVNDPGRSWDEHREALGMAQSPYFRKACNELEADGLCTLKDKKVYAA